MNMSMYACTFEIVSDGLADQHALLDIVLFGHCLIGLGGYYNVNVDIIKIKEIVNISESDCLHGVIRN